jgi:hypothetical protein
MIQSGVGEMVLDDEWSSASDPKHLVQQFLALIAFHMVQDVAEQRAIEGGILERKHLPVKCTKRHADRRQNPVGHVNRDHGFPRKRRGDRLGHEPASSADIQ